MLVKVRTSKTKKIEDLGLVALEIYNKMVADKDDDVLKYLAMALSQVASIDFIEKEVNKVKEQINNFTSEPKALVYYFLIGKLMTRSKESSKLSMIS